MFDRCLYFNINSLARSITRHWESAFAPYGLSPAHAYTLRYVLSHPGQASKIIAGEMDVAPSTVTRFVDQLELQGLVKREPRKADGREAIVVPTEKAKAIQIELEKTGKALYKKMRQLLSPDHFDLLVGEARRARGRIEEDI